MINETIQEMKNRDEFEEFKSQLNRILIESKNTREFFLENMKFGNQEIIEKFDDLIEEIKSF